MRPGTAIKKMFHAYELLYLLKFSLQTIYCMTILGEKVILVIIETR
jgi:hypothetical protein